MDSREELHAVADELPDEELAGAVRFLKYLRDTSEHSRSRQPDPEHAYQVNEAAPSGIQDLVQSLKQGKGISDKDLLERLGRQS